MKTQPIATLIISTALACAFTSCDSKEEQVRKEMIEAEAKSMEASADRLRKDGEKAAEAQESTATAIRKNSEANADANEDAADATRKAVEKRADEIEAEADKVRDQK